MFTQPPPQFRNLFLLSSLYPLVPRLGHTIALPCSWLAFFPSGNQRTFRVAKLPIFVSPFLAPGLLVFLSWTPSFGALSRANCSVSTPLSFSPASSPPTSVWRCRILPREVEGLLGCAQHNAYTRDFVLAHPSPSPFPWTFSLLRTAPSYSLLLLARR